MNWVVRVYLAIALIALTPTAQSLADPHQPCFACAQEVGDLHSITCEHGHTLDSECLQEQLRHGENESHKESMADIAAQGFPCPAKLCKARIPFEQFLAALPHSSQELIHQRIAAEKNTNFLNDRAAQSEIQFLHAGILRAATLTCPAQGCHNALGPKDACCAATCLSKSCERSFCYLCLKLFSNAKSAESHIGSEHTGQSSFENRPGYIERYHWLLIRESMEMVFSSRIHPKIRELVLQLPDVRQVLSDRKLWPFPAGISSYQFQQEVIASELSLKESVELLQNEFIFLFKRDPKGEGTTLLANAIRHWGGKVLASLDARDQEGLPEGNERPAASALNPHELEAQEIQAQIDDLLNFGRQQVAGAQILVQDGRELVRLPRNAPARPANPAPERQIRRAEFGPILDTPPRLVRQIERKTFDRIIPRAFANSGTMHAMIFPDQATSLVWSATLHNRNTRNERNGRFDFDEAAVACQGLGNRRSLSRLPNYSEAQELTQAYSFQYDVDLNLRVLLNPNVGNGRLFLEPGNYWTGSLNHGLLGNGPGARIFHRSAGAVAPDTASEIEPDLFNSHHRVVCVLEVPTRTLMTYLDPTDDLGVAEVLRIRRIGR